MITNALNQLLRACLPAGTRIAPSTDKSKVTGDSRVLFTRIDSDRPTTDDGKSGIVVATYQLDFFAPTLASAEALVAKVCMKYAPDGSGGIENFKGTIDTTKIDTISIQTDSFQKQDPIEGATGTFARCLQDVSITYRE